MPFAKKLLCAALVLSAAILSFYIFSAIPLRWDFTSNKVYTLSENSERLLEKIEDPIELTFYYSRSVKNLPAPFKSFASRVEEMLRQYSLKGHGSILLNVVDPVPESTAEKQAIASGLLGQPVSATETVFFGLVANYSGAEKAIEFFDPNKETFLEHDISRLIFEVQQFALPRVTIVTSLRLEAPPKRPVPGQLPDRPDQFMLQELKRSYRVQVVRGFAEELPSETDVLAIIHPQKLSEPLLYAIDQHVLSGKPTFITVDPYSRFVAQQNQAARDSIFIPSTSEPASDLRRLFESWGIEYDSSKIVADMVIPYTEPGFVQPTWLIMGPEQQDKSLLPLSNISGSLLIEPGAFDLSDDSPLSLQRGLFSSRLAGYIDRGVFATLANGQYADSIEPAGGELTLAGMLKGRVGTAFPDGPPERAADSAPQLQSGDATLFVVADSDFLLDPYSIQRGGYEEVVRINDNQSLVANIFDFLSGSKDLIGIRGKESSVRPFEVVQRLEQKAQTSFQAKQRRLESEMATVQQQIGRLAQNQPNASLFQTTPEIQEAILDLREKEVDLRNELRSVRIALRREIESLEMRLVFINAAYVPVVLVAFAAFYYARRKSRRVIAIGKSK